MVCVVTPGVKFIIVKNAPVLGHPPPLHTEASEFHRPAASVPSAAERLR